MQRIMIIGGPGSGKSTLARRLGDVLDLPVYHMDREVHWLPGWVERAPEAKTPIVLDIVARTNWVFEGGHSATYAARLARADMLIWLDVPIWLRLVRVIRRAIVQWGQTRSDMQEGCVEDPRMLPGFLRFILRVRRRSRVRMSTLFDEASVAKHRLRSLRDVDQFMRSIASDGS